MSALPAIECREVGKTFRRRLSSVSALSGLDFSVAQGEYVCLLGRTGGGKSTTLNLVLGLFAPSQGQVRVLGHDPHAEFAALRGRIGCVFQGDRLLPWRSILDNVRLPLEVLRLDEERLPISPRQWLARVGLADFADAYPNQLSGGMRQRAAMARALVSDPQIVLADEAFGHLDEVTGRQLKQDFRSLSKAAGKTVLHITHSIDEAIAQADRILVLGAGGRIVGEHRPAQARDAGQDEALRQQLYRQIEASPRLATGAAHA